MYKIENKYTAAILTLLLLVAALPRFYDLNALGFYGDEETSAFAARSLAEGKGMAMPSGMPYLRSMPQTLANALSAKAFGLDKEFAYRLPATIIGTLTVPLLFLVSRSFVGASTALLAALLLAFSEWHIITSREARMYAPFLFFYIATAFALLQWNLLIKLRHALFAFIFFIGTATLHPLGIMAVQFAAIPVAFPNWSRLNILPVTIFIAAAVISAYLYSNAMEFSPYDIWKQSRGLALPPETANDSSAPFILSAAFTAPQYLTWLLLIGGMLLGLWLAYMCPMHEKYPGHRLRNIGLFIMAGLTGALLCTGQVYAGALAAVVFLIIHQGERLEILRSGRLPLALIFMISATTLIIAISQHGPVTAIKNALMFPYPYLAYFADISPELFIIFTLTCGYLLLKRPSTDDLPLKAMMLSFFLPIAVIGIESRWGGARYLIGSYPFFLIISAAGIVFGVQKLVRALNITHPRNVFISTILVALSGVIGGHGIPQSISANQLDYGEPFNPHALGMGFYPDHQSTGIYVRQHMQKGDIIIAEDMLEQYWYVGKVDYWLIDKAKSWQYLYRDENGLERDIYVSSEILSPDKIAALAGLNKRIWLITSGESFQRRELTLNKAQIDWLTSIEKNYTPVYSGRDNVTKVYCMNCQ